MYPQVSDVTRVSSTAATKIDNVFSNINSCKSTVDELRLSDHKAIITTIDASYKLEEYYIKRRCNINEKSFELCKIDFQNINWDDVVKKQSTLDWYHNFHVKTLDFLDKHFPIINKKIKPHYIVRHLMKHVKNNKI